jgi:hypothetical protein
VTLTDEQRGRVRTFLSVQGLTFQPLLEEMVDHVSTDLEEKMTSDISFDEAWQQTFNELPEHHFKTLQKETMETINRGFTISRSLTFATIALVMISLLLKSIHFSGGGEMLLAAFATMIGSLLFSSVSGIRLNRDKKGRVRLLVMVAGIGVMAVAFAFKLLHLVGADQLVMLGVAVTVVSLIANTLYVHKHTSGSGNLLTFLHEKYTPGIERFFLFLLVPLVILRLAIIFNPGQEFAGGIVTLMVIFGAGLQLVVLSWRTMERDFSKRTSATMTATMVSGALMCLVFLGPILPVELRVGMIMAYSVVTAWLAYTMEAGHKNIASQGLAILVPVIFISWGLVRLSVLPSTFYPVIFNIPILLLLIVALLFCKKYEMMRAFAIVSLASYLFEYVV